MDRLILMAVLLLSQLGGVAYAQGGWLDEFEENKPEGPEAAVLGQINLGALITLYFNDIPYGNTQARIAENNVRLGVASSPIAPDSGYAHEGFTYIISPSMRYLLPDDKTYLFGQLVRIDTDEDDSNPSSSETLIGNFRFGFQSFYTPDAMFGGFVEYSDLASDSGGAYAKREAINLRFDYIRRFSNEWGFAGRALYSFGELDLDIFGDPTTADDDVNEKGGNDHLYLQGEFLQTLTPVDISAIPEDWEINNKLGVSLNRAFLDDVTDSSGELVPGKTFNTGSVWGSVTLGKPPEFNRFSPAFTLGLEHEHSVSESELIEDDTYVILGAEVVRLDVQGSTLTLILDHRQGFEGDRVYTNVVAAYSYNF